MIPKNACSSIRHMILKHMTGQEKLPYDLHELKKMDKVDYQDLNSYQNYFWFAFLRNPFDRVIACYKDKVLSEQGDEIYKALYNPDMKFPDFVDFVVNTDDLTIDWHLKSQDYYIGRYIDDMNFVGTVENFKRDIDILRDKIKCKFKPEHLRKTKPFDRNKYFSNPKIIEKITTRYKADFEMIEEYGK